MFTQSNISLKICFLAMSYLFHSIIFVIFSFILNFIFDLSSESNIAISRLSVSWPFKGESLNEYEKIKWLRSFLILTISATQYTVSDDIFPFFHTFSSVSFTFNSNSTLFSLYFFCNSISCLTKLPSRPES